MKYHVEVFKTWRWEMDIDASGVAAAREKALAVVRRGDVKLPAADEDILAYAVALEALPPSIGIEKIE